MGGRRYVFLDPDGAQGRDWLYVIVQAPTGIFYEQQYGGTATLRGHAEGYLVPVDDGRALAELRTLFEGDLRGTGASRYVWPADLLQRLRSAVTKVVLWGSAATSEGLSFISPQALVLDEERLREIDEAWIPVITADGPGILVWPNSD